MKIGDESVFGNLPPAGSQEQNETSEHDSDKEESRWKAITFSL